MFFAIGVGSGRCFETLLDLRFGGVRKSAQNGVPGHGLGQPLAGGHHRRQPVSGLSLDSDSLAVARLLGLGEAPGKCQTGRPAMYAISPPTSTLKPIIGPLNEV